MIFLKSVFHVTALVFYHVSYTLDIPLLINSAVVLFLSLFLFLVSTTSFSIYSVALSQLQSRVSEFKLSLISWERKTFPISYFLLFPAVFCQIVTRHFPLACSPPSVPLLTSLIPSTFPPFPENFCIRYPVCLLSINLDPESL